MPSGVETYLSEIARRQFSYHLLFQFPTLPEAPLRPEFAQFPWGKNAKGLAAWQRGLTGYPIVDAGMRELWSTGWMQNRVRMIVPSFLIKDLLLHWRAGEKWFWNTAPSGRRPGLPPVSSPVSDGECEPRHRIRASQTPSRGILYAK
jgi:deoxyribodipyrimidine photo-lyase